MEKKIIGIIPARGGGTVVCGGFQPARTEAHRALRGRTRGGKGGGSSRPLYQRPRYRLP